MSNTVRNVDAKMKKLLAKNKNELDMAQITPFSDEFQFGKNGLSLFIAPQGGGKSYNIAKYIFMTEALSKEPFFNLITFCSTNEGLDKTLETFKKSFKTKTIFISEKGLLAFLTKFIARQRKFYSMYNYVKSGGKAVDKTLGELFKKHGCINKKKEVKYVNRKIQEYGRPSYPNNMLLILDDFLGCDLLENKNSPVVKILTKLRHYNITVIISQQSTKGIGRTCRRLASDCILWRGIGYDDFMDFIKETPLRMDRDTAWQLYNSLKNKHDFFELHFHNDTYSLYRHQD